MSRCPSCKSPDVAERPCASRQIQCVSRGGWADKAARCLRRGLLKAEYGVLALAKAGSAQVRRVSGAIFVRALRVYEDASASEWSQFVANELMAPAYNLCIPFFKFEFFVLEPRQIVLKQRLAALEREHCGLGVNESSQKIGGGFGQLDGVPLCAKSFCNGLCARDGGNGHLNFTEHGQPQKVDRALSGGKGAPEVTTAEEVSHG